MRSERIRKKHLHFSFIDQHFTGHETDATVVVRLGQAAHGDDLVANYAILEDLGALEQSR